MTRPFATPRVQILLVLLAAAAWKALFILWDVLPFNADEAVVALMARHITQGARPVFFYGQAYMGSLDAFLVAFGFRVFGEQVWVIRLVQALLYLATIYTVYWIGRVAFHSHSTGLLAALLLAVPTVNVTLYTTASLGGYGEALLLGSLAVLTAVLIARPGITRPPWLLFLLFGLLTGCGLWANGLSLVFTAPAGLYILWALLRRPARIRWLVTFLALAAVGFFLGSLPWWLYALRSGPDRLVLELFGTAVAVEQDPWLVRTGQHLVNFLLLGVTVLLGIRPPWTLAWLALPLIPLALAFWLAVTVFFFRRLGAPGPDRPIYALLAGICAVLVAGFLFTPFGIDPSGRYFVPLALPLALVAARLLLAPAALPPAVQSRRWLLTGAALALLLIFHGWGTLQCALRYPPGLTTQFYEKTIVDHRYDADLIAFLLAQGETRGYTTYWVAYPLAFHSQEELIFVPRLPYHVDLRYTPRDDRYAPYDDVVAASPRAAYITAGNPLLVETLRAAFTAQSVTWREQPIGDYLVFFALSRPVRPQEIGFGELRP